MTYRIQRYIELINWMRSLFSFAIRFEDLEPLMISLLHHHFPDNMRDYVRQLQRFNVGEDCPVFDGRCVVYVGGDLKTIWRM